MQCRRRRRPESPTSQVWLADFRFPWFRLLLVAVFAWLRLVLLLLLLLSVLLAQRQPAAAAAAPLTWIHCVPLTRQAGANSIGLAA